MLQPQRIPLKTHLEYFIGDCRAANLSPRTIDYYRDKLLRFLSWAALAGVSHIDDVTPHVLRAYLTYLQESHSAGGVDAYWRAISAFLSFLERDDVLAVNPLRKLRRPKVDRPLQAPIAIADIRAMLATCKGGGVLDRRDAAIIHVLLDTGVRAGELTRLNIADVDFATGVVAIHKAKSRKGREVFVSAVTRRALRAYLRMRSDDKPLFLTHGTGGEHRITYDGLRSAIESRADKARIALPQLHAFRRTFAITSWRNGVDVTAIARMMGHGSLPVVMRYIAAETSDLAAIHDEHAPTGNL